MKTLANIFNWLGRRFLLLGNYLLGKSYYKVGGYCYGISIFFSWKAKKIYKEIHRKLKEKKA